MTWYRGWHWCFVVFPSQSMLGYWGIGFFSSPVTLSSGLDLHMYAHVMLTPLTFCMTALKTLFDPTWTHEWVIHWLWRCIKHTLCFNFRWEKLSNTLFDFYLMTWLTCESLHAYPVSMERLIHDFISVKSLYKFCTTSIWLSSPPPAWNRTLAQGPRLWVDTQN